MKIKINKLEQTEDFAKKLASGTEKGDVIELVGDLGSGKTTFAQFFIGSLMVVPSINNISHLPPSK